MDPLYAHAMTQALRPGMRGVDLGSGDGEIAGILSDTFNVDVTGVDTNACTHPHPRVLWRQMTIDAWIREWVQRGGVELFDFAYTRNLLNQLDHDYVLDILLLAMHECVKPGGFVVIETFYDFPSPPLKPRGFPSIYRLEELLAAFPGWEILYAQEEEPRKRERDLTKTIHTWHSVRCILRRPISP